MFNSPRSCVLLVAIAALTGCKAGESKQSASTANASAPVWALSTRSAEARQHVDSGERLADRGRDLQAYEQFKRAVAADSAFAFAYLRVARTAQSLDEYKVNLQRAFAYESSANDIEKLLIEIERRKFNRDPLGAVEVSRQLVQREPKNPRSWWALGESQFGAGQTDSARAALTAAIPLAPLYGTSDLVLGSMYLLAPQDLVKAEQHVLRGQQLWPNEPITYDYLGDVRRAQGRLEEAATAYGRQIALAPDQFAGYIQRGHSYLFLGKYNQASADYDAAIRHGRGNEPAFAALMRTYVSMYAGDPTVTLGEIQQYVQAVDGMGAPEPDGLKLGALNAEMLLAEYAHQFDVAEKTLGPRNALDMKMAQRLGTPQALRGAQANAAFEEGRLAAFKGDFATAKRKAAEYRTLVADDNDASKERPIHALLGFTALFEKRYVDAITEFDQGDPDAVFQWYHKALALEGAGRTAEAKTLFKQVAGYNFNSAGYAAVRRDAIAKAGS
jgi:tetratricopeptide (TPR) repeat protein